MTIAICNIELFSVTNVTLMNSSINFHELAGIKETTGLRINMWHHCCKLAVILSFIIIVIVIINVIVMMCSGSIDGNNQLIIKGRFQQKQIESVLRRYISKSEMNCCLLTIFLNLLSLLSFVYRYIPKNS